VRGGASVVAAAALALTAACTGPVPGRPDATAAAAAPPYADCAGLDAPPPEAAPDAPPPEAAPDVPPPEAAGAGTAAAGAPATPAALPAITLPCFSGGGAPVALAGLRGPAVVNLWASWCGPCRVELPELQRYAERAADRVHVVGVVTEDPAPERPASLAIDLGLTFPSLFDPDGRLLAALGRSGLPATLFVDAAGAVRFIHHAQALDEAAVERLVAQHLGVVAAADGGAGER